MSSFSGIKRVFCDAGFFIALFSKRDRLHSKAVQLFQELTDRRIAIITTWPIVSEAMTVLLYHFGYSEATAFGSSIDFYEIMTPTESQYQQALAIFNHFNRDRIISMVDALSYVLITGPLKNMPALSFDQDFKSLGLTVVN